VSEKYNDGTSFEGEKLNNMKDGFGIEIDFDGNTFEGHFKANKKTGKGK